MRAFANKLRDSIVKRPTRYDALILLRELAWLTPALALCVAMSDTMRWNPEFDSATLRLALIALVIPSLGEELLFRAALLPTPQAGQQMPLPRAATAIALFVLWHPLQALVTTDERATIFLDPWFLLAVGALGLACTRAYWRNGSLWPAVILHWLSVIGWKALAGGPAFI
ncbi:MAG: CPBP family glutamic-type intramembrane protease [Erythrobacter sp.]|nr:CPBP family glutamic-type intramembrane protease [Erythrobacter sp.]